MVLIKKWKNNWALKSLNFNELFDIVAKVISKHLENVKKENISLNANFALDYDADSVDIITMLVLLEGVFKKSAESTNTKLPLDKLAQIKIVEDLFDVIYEALLEMENKMEPFTTIVPDVT